MATKFQQENLWWCYNIQHHGHILQALYYLASISFTISNFGAVNADVPLQDAWWLCLWYSCMITLKSQW